MKIAYLITAYNNPIHLRRLIEALNDDNANFFVHLDRKSKSQFDLPKSKNIYVLENNIEVFWGSYTFVEAVLLLLNKAKAIGTYDYYALISGTDYPVKGKQYIINFLTENKGKEFINICKMPENDKTFDRIEYFYYSDFLYSLQPVYLYKRLINYIVRFFKIKRKLPNKYSNFTLYGGSNWWILSNECVNYVLNFIKNNPQLCKFYKNTYIPEEMFFHTIIGNAPFMKNVWNSVTYADWNIKEKQLPAQIGKKHIKIFLKDWIKSKYGNGKMYILFARKFSDKSETVIEKINSLIKNT